MRHRALVCRCACEHASSVNPGSVVPGIGLRHEKHIMHSGPEEREAFGSERQCVIRVRGRERRSGLGERDSRLEDSGSRGFRVGRF
jgi:hypothetical protein